MKITDSSNYEILMMGTWSADYSDQMTFDEFCDQVEQGIISIEEPPEKDTKDELCQKGNRTIKETCVEDDTLHIDITLGIDNIIKEITSCEASHVIIYADNKDYEDLEKLKNLNKDIKIIYDHSRLVLPEPITIDEFQKMRQFINDIVNSIKEQHLTPVEEIMVLYNLIKWYQYNYDEENPNNARDIHSFVSTGQIICAGYSKLFAQIAIELGHNAFVCLIDSSDYIDGSEGHERNAIYIDDDVYGIHGLYYLDITFDSTEHESLGEKYGEDVQKSNLFFQCFLFTLEQYGYLFPNEIKPVNIDNVEKIIPYIQENFKDINIDNLRTPPKEIDMETIKRIYKSTMLKCRINKEQVEEMIQKINDHNKIQQEILEYNGSDTRGFRK